MIFGQETMNEVIEKIASFELRYSSSIVIGDNSSGKSLLLKKFINKIKKNHEVYFIDAVNRGFDVKKISKLKEKPEYKSSILNKRMEDDFFNLLDSFNCYGTLTECVEMIYSLYEKNVQDLFFELTGDRFKILSGNTLGEVEFERGKGLLSSGYQAIVRIVLELLYYQEMVVIKKNIKEAWVVIDEIDEFLSPRYSAAILEFLKKEFSWANWLITTHSCDLVTHTSEMNLIILNGNDCEVLDINDYNTVSEVQIIFDRLFGKMNVGEDEIETILRRLLNNRIGNMWTKNDEEELAKIQKQKLTASQQIIIRQIQEW